MALIGSALALRCSCGGTLLVGKVVQPLQSVKPIRIAVSTVLDESWCGHCWGDLESSLSFTKNKRVSSSNDFKFECDSLGGFRCL
jgi:hypothetical protein